LRSVALAGAPRDSVGVRTGLGGGHEGSVAATPPASHPVASARRFPPPPTSGHARLWWLDEPDARTLANGDVLLTRWPTGYLPLIILGPRAAETGELGEPAQPCVVVDTIVAHANTVANVEYQTGATSQTAAPGAVRLNTHAYLKGDKFTAVCDDGVTRSFIVTQLGVTAGGQPGGYAVDTLNLADGTAKVSRYTAAGELPVIDKSLGFTTQYGDRRGRRYFGSGTPHIASDYEVSAGWGGAPASPRRSSPATRGAGLASPPAPRRRRIPR
jgi:hypothetical protein